MKNCTGANCPMQTGKVDTATCDINCQYRTKPMTNGDRIRAMSDEELSILLHNECCRPNNTACPRLQSNCFDMFPLYCKKCWSVWLKEEAENAAD